MDPNVLLAELVTEARDLIARNEALEGGEGVVDYETVADLGAELAQRFLDLDTWLRRGGFLPEAWSPVVTPGPEPGGSTHHQQRPGRPGPRRGR